MSTEATEVRHMTARFGRDTAEVGHARRAIDTALRAWGLADDAPPVVLAASELLSNAIVHGDGPIDVVLEATDGAIHLEVADDGGAEPVMRTPDPTGAVPGGWGLRFVDELADEWGTRRDDGRTVVWMRRWPSTRSDAAHPPTLPPA